MANETRGLRARRPKNAPCLPRQVLHRIFSTSFCLRENPIFSPSRFARSLQRQICFTDSQTIERKDPWSNPRLNFQNRSSQILVTPRNSQKFFPLRNRVTIQIFVSFVRLKLNKNLDFSVPQTSSDPQSKILFTTKLCNDPNFLHFSIKIKFIFVEYIYIFFFAFFEEIVISRERLFGAIGLTNRVQKRSRKLVPVHDNLARFFALVPRLPFSPVSPCIPVTYRNHGRIPGPLFVPVYRCTRAAATRPATAGQVIRTHGPCSSTFLSCPVSGGPGEAASYVESYYFSFDRIFLLHIHI